MTDARPLRSAPLHPRPPRGPRSELVDRWNGGLAGVSWLMALVIVGLIGSAVWMAWRDAEERRALIEAERARFAAYLVEQEEAMRALPRLSNGEIAQLRRSLNARHVALGRQYGVAPVANRDQLSRLDGRLVRIETNPGYHVRRMSASVPYLTPDGAASLDLIAARFAERLGERGLPPFQFVVTSVLRTEADQRRLRRTNRNAAIGTSSHFFGTTYDLHYQQFGFGADLRPHVEAALGPLPYDFLLDAFADELETFYRRMAERYPSRLGALLGQVLIELEDERALVALREVQQPVYHVTIARQGLIAEARAAQAASSVAVTGSSLSTSSTGS